MMSLMSHSITPHHNAEFALQRLEEMYPLAFALASASTFRTGLALRKRESVRPLLPAIPASLPVPFAGSASNPPRLELQPGCFEK